MATGGAGELLATPTCATAYKQEVQQDSAADLEDVTAADGTVRCCLERSTEQTLLIRQPQRL